jgi:hypothetical protein
VRDSADYDQYVVGDVGGEVEELLPFVAGVELSAVRSISGSGGDCAVQVSTCAGDVSRRLILWPQPGEGGADGTL